MTGLLSELDKFQMTHWRPSGQMSPELAAIEAAKRRAQELYAKPTDPTVAGFPVSEYLPPHARPSWRAMGLLGEMLAPTATKEAAERGASPTMGLLSDVAGSVPVSKGLLAMAALPGAARGIRAFHGSPHSFDRFDLSKIGTGEGAQAYGHGLYFAEKEGVARSYKAAGQPNYLDASRIQAAQDILKEAGGDRLKAIALADQRMRGTTKYSEGRLWQDVVNNFDDLVGKGPGHMYEVNIKANPEDFLDWDGGKLAPKIPAAVLDAESRSFYKMPASEINDAAKEFLAKRIIENPAGIQALREAGIPGIKYLDQGSRASGEGSRNYVVFDDKLIEILRKYGIAPFALGGAAASMGGETQP